MENLTKLIYATPIHENNFYIFNNEEKGSQKEIILFTSLDELNNYKKTHNNCSFIYLRYRDIISIKNCYNLELISVYLTNDYVLNFSDENIDAFYQFYAYENINGSSTFITGQPSESYEKAIEILTPKFEEYEEITNVWLYHIFELKNKASSVINDKYEELYDVFVVEVDESNFINIRDYIDKTIQETNNHSVKVALHNSDMGLFLLQKETNPIYSKQ